MGGAFVAAQCSIADDRREDAGAAGQIKITQALRKIDGSIVHHIKKMSLVS